MEYSTLASDAIQIWGLVDFRSVSPDRLGSMIVRKDEQDIGLLGCSLHTSTQQTGQHQGQGYANPVVRPQRGVIGPQPITIYNILDGIFGKIMGRFGRFFTDHVHVAL